MATSKAYEDVHTFLHFNGEVIATAHRHADKKFFKLHKGHIGKEKAHGLGLWLVNHSLGIFDAEGIPTKLGTEAYRYIIELQKKKIALLMSELENKEGLVK